MMRGEGETDGAAAAAEKKEKEWRGVRVQGRGDMNECPGDLE